MFLLLHIYSKQPGLKFAHNIHINLMLHMLVFLDTYPVTKVVMTLVEVVVTVQDQEFCICHLLLKLDSVGKPYGRAHTLFCKFWSLHKDFAIIYVY